jgi:hypothetical protein
MSKPQAPHVLALYRRILLQAQAGGCTVALEDDFHHFVLNLQHDGQQATALHTQTLRSPWTICSQAEARLQAFVGRPLQPRPLATLGDVDAKQQCTHQYDLALLALAHAHRGGQREYRARVTDPQDGRMQATLWCEGAVCLDWPIEQGTQIQGAGLFGGRDLRSLLPWALQTLDDDALEAVFVLRRACMVSMGRTLDLDQFTSAEGLMARKAGACFVFQPERYQQARRCTGNTRHDIRGHADLLREPPR